MLKISDITIEKLESGELEKDLPEFYALKHCIENNAWHKNESVFRHTLKVLKELKSISQTFKKKTLHYLEQSMDEYKRKDLLFLATLFHDIGKPETIRVKEGLTYCPEHELVGSEKIKTILPRFSLSEEERERIIMLVKNHGEIHILLDQKNNLDERLSHFREKYSSLFIELVLLGMADTFGSQIRETDNEEFLLRKKFYEDLIDKDFFL